MKNLKMIVAVFSMGLLVGCGGGGSSGDSTTTPPLKPPVQPPVDLSIEDSGGKIYENTYLLNYSFKGHTFYYYTPDCTFSSFYGFDYVVYVDNTAKLTSYDQHGTVYNVTECSVEKKYLPIRPIVDGAIDAVKITSKLYYDNNTKIYYVVDNYGLKGTLVEIKNDGQTVVDSNGSENPLIDIYKEAELSN